MNPLVRLLLAVVLGVAWFAVYQLYGTETRLAKLDPATVQERRRLNEAMRAMAFFGLAWFISSTVVIFGAGAILAVVAPPNTRGFADAFNEIVNSSSNVTGLLSPLSLGGAITTLLATVPAIWISQRYARRQPLLDLGLRYYKEWPVDMLLGLLLGPLLFAFIFQAETFLGYLVGSSGPNYNWPELAKWVAVFLCIAISEELVVRGYFLQVINQTWGGLAAISITSSVWGFAHLLNPRATLLGALNIIVVGLVFAYAYNFTGRLWLPIALHFSWNMAQGAIFGFRVSGYEVTNSIFQPFINGPQEVTGGLFGPEGGLILLPSVVLGGLILYGWQRGRHSSQPQNNQDL